MHSLLRVGLPCESCKTALPAATAGTEVQLLEENKLQIPTATDSIGAVVALVLQRLAN